MKSRWPTITKADAYAWTALPFETYEMWRARERVRMQRESYERAVREETERMLSKVIVNE